MRRALLSGICLLLSAACSADLTVDGSYRLRFEALNNTFRAIGAVDDELLAGRLIIDATWSGDHWYAEGKLHDARAWLHQPDSIVTNGDVNALSISNARIGWRGPLSEGGDDLLDISIGRQALDISTRRLVTENVYRNTTNIFTGARLTWTNEQLATDLFYGTTSFPRPNITDIERLRDNGYQSDYDSLHTRFWSAHLRWWHGDLIVDGLVIGLDESDRPGIPTRNRDIVTFSGRLSYPLGEWQLEAEAYYQTGHAMQNVLTTRLLDVSSYYLHLDARYSFASGTVMRLQYDYGRGDDDPTDGSYGRFDAMFDARPIDLPLTGLFGPLFRGNLNSPAIAFTRSFEFGDSTLQWHGEYRPAWLASDGDFIQSAGIINRPGESLTFMGHFLELQGRFRRGNVDINPGFSYIIKGDLMERGLFAPMAGNTLYFFAQVEISF